MPRPRRTVRLGMYATLAPTILNEATAVLSSWFEANGSRRIEFEFSPSYATTLQAALTGDLEFYALEPHAAYFFIHQRGFQPVVRTLGKVDLLVFVRATGELRAIADLRGKTLAITSLLSATGSEALRALRDVGLTPDVDVEIHSEIAQDRIVIDVLSGRFAAGAVSRYTFEALTPTLREAVRVLHRYGGQAAFVIVAPPHVPPEEVDHIASLYVAYSQSPAWQDFRFNITIRGFELFTLADLEDQARSAEQIHVWVQANSKAIPVSVQRDDAAIPAPTP